MSDDIQVGDFVLLRKKGWDVLGSVVHAGLVMSISIDKFERVSPAGPRRQYDEFTMFETVDNFRVVNHVTIWEQPSITNNFEIEVVR